MSVYLSCDGPQCDHTIAQDFARESGSWLVLSWMGPIAASEHFCSHDCALRSLARIEPPTVVPA